MAEKNILIKRHNGTDWDNIYPITKAKNVVLSDSTNVEDRLSGKEDISKKGVANGYAELDANGKVPVSQVPETHSHSNKAILDATTASFTTTDKTKLNGIATGANNYSHPAGDGNLHVPATGTTNSGKVLKAGATAGSLSWDTVKATDIVEDSTHKFITDAERTSWNGKASTSVATTSVNGLMSSSDKSKLDGIATGANNYVHPANHPASIITQDANNRFVTDTEKGTWNAKASTSVVTTSANGLMSSTDKTKLDGIASGANNYVHPSSHPATMITQDASNRFVTDAEKATWNAKASASHTHPEYGFAIGATQPSNGMWYKTI